jgi:apolipoprotein N-acyltransferase
MSASNNKQFLVNQIMWMGISFGISIAISMLVPFPLSLVIIMGVFILLNLYMRNRMMRRGGSGMLFGSMPSSSMFGGNSIRYYCMTCGMQHNQAACPRCGSKMKRVGS